MNAAALNLNELSSVKKLSDKELISKVSALVRQERQVIDCLIWHLQEVQDRKLYIQMGYTSLYECLVKHFGYSEGTAYARIGALKIIAVVPEASQALSKGEVTLTTLSLAQTFIRKQEKHYGKKIPKESQHQILEAIKNKSTQDVKQTLAAIHPAEELPPDRVIYLSKNDVQIQATTDKLLLEKIQHLKNLISHDNVNPSYHEILHMAFDALIANKEKAKGLSSNRFPLKKNSGNDTKVTQSNSDGVRLQVVPGSGEAPKMPSRYISRFTKAEVLKNSQGRCQFVNKNGERCESSFQLQFDHIYPFSHGGGSEQSNIQLLCRVHNSFKGARIVDQKSEDLE